MKQFFPQSPTDNIVQSDFENKHDLQWYNLPVALLSSILRLSSWRYEKNSGFGDGVWGLSAVLHWHQRF